MSFELTKNIDRKYVEGKNENVEKNVKMLILSLKIRDIEEEINQLSKRDMNYNLDNQILQLKKYEIELKAKLSSTLI
jgi:hypothetical protein